MKTNGVTRRGFMKTASVAGGVTIATGFNPFSYAANEKVNLGLIGVGGQGTFHITYGLAGTAEVQIAAICDIFEENRNKSVKFSQLSNAGIPFRDGMKLTSEQIDAAKSAMKPDLYWDYKELLARDDIDAVVISTPLDRHHVMTMDALNAGKYVFCEKTMCYNIEQSREIVQKCADTGLFCQVGHQRRYNPKYNLGMRLARDSDKVGRISHISAQWHRNVFWRRNYENTWESLTDTEKEFILPWVGGEPDIDRFLNWRMYEEYSKGLFTELMTHQSDIANWFMMGVPSKVYATGGIDYWRDGREVDDNIQVIFEYEQQPSSPGFKAIDQRSQLQDMRKINRTYSVRFDYSSQLFNGKMGCTEQFMGDYGTIELSGLFIDDPCYLYPEPAAAAAKAGAAATGKALNTYMPGAGAGAGIPLFGDVLLEEADTYQFRAFAKHIREGGKPRTNEMCGHTTAIAAHMAYESCKTGQPVTIDPALYTFDVEVPSFYEFETEWVEFPKDPAKAEGAAPAAPAQQADPNA
ncbi:MAG: twin-arginine translocation signal domain-containing protein [Candidatus Hydrogenedens sp.]|nr:twin-arginine translocation signal domain-containing protein [Candidatus Hydrogenedens sp.]